MSDTDTESASRGDERQYEDRLLNELLRLQVDLNANVRERTAPDRVGPHRRSGLRSRTAAGFVASLAVVIALVVVTVTTQGRGATKPNTGPPLTSVFTAPTQTSTAAWNLTGLVAASGWHPQSVGATSPVQLTCPTEQTCIASGVDLGVDQNSLPRQQNDIEVSNDGGATWRVAEVPPDGAYFSGFTCPSSTTCMTVGVLPNEGSAAPPPSLYTTTDGGATWTVRPIPGVVWETAALACWTTASCIVVGQAEGFAAYVTNDAGQAWTSSQLPAGFIGPSDSDSLQCSSDGRCVAMGIASLAYSAAPAFAYSTDGGRMWKLGKAPYIHAGAGSVLSCSDALHCLAVENAGLQNGLVEVRGVVTTSDGGRSWIATSALGLNPNSAPRYLRIGALVCVSSRMCIASGQSGGSATFDSNVATQGLVEVTSNGGQTWHPESLPTINHRTIQQTSTITCSGDSQVCFVGAFTASVASSVILESHIQAVESQ
jgi:hypothetical protein